MSDIQDNLANASNQLHEQPVTEEALQNPETIAVDARAVQSGNEILVYWSVVRNEASSEVEIKRIHQDNGFVDIVLPQQRGAMPPFHDRTTVRGVNYKYQIIISQNGQVVSVQSTQVIHRGINSKPVDFNWGELDDTELENIAQTIKTIQEERQQGTQVQQPITTQQETLEK